MLPTVQLAEDYKVGIHFASGQECVITRAYAPRFDLLIEATVAADESLDGFLSKSILRGSSKHPLKSHLMFWYMAIEGVALLYVTDKNARVACSWLRQIPGCYASARDYIGELAVPFLQWDGEKLWRVHEPMMHSYNKFYICDFGSVFGLSTDATDKATYRNIQKNKAENWEYSVVPRESEEVVRFDGEEKILHHAFWRL